MIRLYRRTIFPRWRAKRKTSRETKNPKQEPKAIVLCTTTSQKQNDSNDQKKQHADKQEKHYWDDPQFRFHFSLATVLENVGRLCPLAFYLSYKLLQTEETCFKQMNNFFGANSPFIFSNTVFASPRCLAQEKKYFTSVSDITSLSSNFSNKVEEKLTIDTDALESIRNLTDQYVSAVQNLAGIKFIDKNNDKRAFRHFQNAARLRSSQGLYNLGLCYHLGKGTKVNLTMAAFCYRKAAMKGHGLASFNLAIFFNEGLGGLPADPKIAKELLAQAAEKEVPEAQLYFGIEFLEEKRFQKAVRIFTKLSEKNSPDGQYYLGLCYDSGLGVEKNEKIAAELFTKSAAQGHKRAIQKLQNIQERNGLNSLEVAKSKEQTNGLHVSASVPELSAVVKRSIHSFKNITLISSYLNLMTPYFIVKSTESKSKDNFFIGESRIVKECSSTYLPLNNISLVMNVKT